MGGGGGGLLYACIYNVAGTIHCVLIVHIETSCISCEVQGFHHI